MELIKVCAKTRDTNGGLIEISELKTYLEAIRKGKNAQPISTDDIERATKKLKVLGSGITILTIGQKKMVQSVPCELNIDHTAILTLAQETHFVSPSGIEKQLNWKKDRIDGVLVIRFNIVSYL